MALPSDSSEPSNAEIPFLLRRAPAVLASLATLACGVVVLLISSRLRAHHMWASDVLVNIGSTVFLFAPLALISAFFGRQIARKGIARDSKVSQLTEQVEEVRHDVDSVLSDINRRTAQRISADRAEQERDIAAIAADPQSGSIAKALQLGIEQDYLSKNGPRVRTRNTDAYIRWTVETEGSNDLKLIIEARDGTPVEEFTWTNEQPADEFGHSLGRILLDADAYPGDVAYDVGSIFRELHNLVDLGYRTATGAGGLVDPIGPIIELVGEQWVLTDYWITTRSAPYYQITLDRLDESDWDAHMREKSWVDIVEFRMVFDTAKELVGKGTLEIPDYERDFQVRLA